MSEAIRLIFKSFQRVSGVIYGDNKENLKRAEVELSELERLADIGRATEKFLKQEDVLYDVDYCIDNFSCRNMRSVEELLEWAKEQDK